MMIEKKGMIVFAMFFTMGFLFACFIVSLVSATANLSIKVTGTINNYSSDFYFKVDNNSNNAVDVYDMLSPSDPGGDVPVLYSSVDGNNAAIDSANATNRTINLTYTLPTAQTGTINFSWQSLNNTGYNGSFVYYGNDSTYTTAVATYNMRSYDFYTGNLIGNANIYARIIINTQTEGTVAVAITGTAAATPTSSSGGGGGTYTKPQSRVENLVIDTKEFNIYIILNSTKTGELKLSNRGNSSIKVDINVIGLSGILNIDQISFSLAPGEKKIINLSIMSNNTNPGIYAGRILVNNQEIPVIINVNSDALVFDTSLTISDDSKIIDFGGDIISELNLMPLGNLTNLTVTVKYTIRDYNGNILYSESNEVLINGKKTIRKNFSTKGIGSGKYVLGVEVTYPKGVASSSSRFEIKSREINYYTIGIIILILLVSFIIVIVLLVKYYQIHQILKKMRRLNKK